MVNIVQLNEIWGAYQLVDGGLNVYGGSIASRTFLMEKM